MVGDRTAGLLLLALRQAGLARTVIHYHGTPITPREVIGRLAGRSFCVSYASPQDVAVAHTVGQSVALDCGAFTIWRKGTEGQPIPARLRAAADGDWRDYYAWAEPWLDYPTTWAVIPDVIDGDEAANDALIREWPFRDRGAPVWHMHEPIERLLRLADEWPRVCVGSSGAFEDVGGLAWRHRMDLAFNALCPTGPVPVWIHMLRGMALAGSEYPFASADSTDVGRNHNRPANDALEMALRWDGCQCPARWEYREQLVLS